jgi:hypothetical protein
MPERAASVPVDREGTYQELQPEVRGDGAPARYVEGRSQRARLPLRVSEPKRHHRTSRRRSRGAKSPPTRWAPTSGTCTTPSSRRNRFSTFPVSCNAVTRPSIDSSVLSFLSNQIKKSDMNLASAIATERRNRASQPSDCMEKMPNDGSIA